MNFVQAASMVIATVPMTPILFLDCKFGGDRLIILFSILTAH